MRSPEDMKMLRRRSEGVEKSPTMPSSSTLPSKAHKISTPISSFGGLDPKYRRAAHMAWKGRKNAKEQSFKRRAAVRDSILCILDESTTVDSFKAGLVQQAAAKNNLQNIQRTKPPIPNKPSSSKLSKKNKKKGKKSKRAKKVRAILDTSIHRDQETIDQKIKQKTQEAEEREQSEMMKNTIDEPVIETMPEEDLEDRRNNLRAKLSGYSFELARSRSASFHEALVDSAAPSSSQPPPTEIVPTIPSESTRSEKRKSRLAELRKEQNEKKKQEEVEKTLESAAKRLEQKRNERSVKDSMLGDSVFPPSGNRRAERPGPGPAV